MSEIQELDVFLGPDGSVRVEVRGVRGPACLALTGGLESALGGAVVARELTAEHDQQAERQDEVVTVGAPP